MKIYNTWERGMRMLKQKCFIMILIVFINILSLTSAELSQAKEYKLYENFNI